MEALSDLLNLIDGFIWGPVTLVLLLGVGIYLTIGLRFMPWRYIVPAFRLLFKSRKASTGEGDITPYQALMTALSATVGTGNIAGVATAIYLGGPGAIFWMWMTALIGMATKYGEAVLAVKYREKDALGNYVGGPMYYIKNGMGKNWRWLGVLFAIFGMLAAFGIGNTVQSNSVADALQHSVGVPTWISGLVIMVIAAAVILGGIKSIASTAEKVVPFMAIAYMGGALIIILMQITKVPAALAMIVSDAFTGTAAAGGFAGSTIMLALRYGVARGVFSNEAGLGSAPIAHAAAQTRDPVQQGLIGMLGTFIDTIVICTMTALVIVLSGLWTSGATGAALSAKAFSAGLPGFGEYLVSFGLALFAFTTILGWSYYGERCAEYLFGEKVILPYRILWILAIPLGAITSLDFIWLLAGVLNGFMAIPNLIALAALSPVIFKLTREHLG
ncbi:MAG: sodium:alanine symporter family protein [Gammaproteobacteria bacterium]|nr:MAG: sodium:alanine symporter family protein [Gammaproteobacteria bacterium]RTZ58328.1 MAG: sodium:alanine symporter family protein [Gammaproteobacteria bacterium]